MCTMSAGAKSEDGDDDRSVGDRRQIGDAPARIVAADERDLVAAADLRFFEEEMQFGDLLGHLVVRKGFALEIVGQRRQLAVSAGSSLRTFGSDSLAA